MTKTIREWIAYYAERYGRAYKLRIEREDEESRVYYYWEKIPSDILDLTAKRVWSRQYTETHGTLERELEFIC